MAFASDSSGIRAKEDAHETIVKDLYSFYTNTVLPIEQAISYQQFHCAAITEGEMRAAPVVLLCGPYSVGKTSFLRYLLGRDFPNMNIGPEPTTDRYSAIMYGPEDRVVPGNTLCVAPLSPFGGCQTFGNGFLTRFEGSMVNSPILKSLTIVDTPGVLSGSKHRERTYDPEAVLEWFAERADMIILILDVYKCDISDEMAETIRILQKNPEKVRVALNKCDAVHQQQLMRVYGAVMWNLAKVLGTPEVCRVYLGSFWEKPPAREETASLLISEMRDMFRDLGMLPRQAAVRRVNEMVKRCRKVRLLACLLDYLRNEMPKMMGVDSKKSKLLADMDHVCQHVASKYNLSSGDFPDIPTFVEAAKGMDFKQFPALKGKRLQHGKLLDKLDDGVTNIIPGLLSLLPTTSSVAEVAGMPAVEDPQQIKAAVAASKHGNGSSSGISVEEPPSEAKKSGKKQSKPECKKEEAKKEETKKEVEKDVESTAEDVKESALPSQGTSKGSAEAAVDSVEKTAAADEEEEVGLEEAAQDNCPVMTEEVERSAQSSDEDAEQEQERQADVDATSGTHNDG
mmetsp:Transcript_9093/g.20269  ORF Transcript_9093/g.20269 Transcript_9093/m.20269 type:complete len:568 (+) Transcript_9093:115-1818(+)